MSEPTLTSAQRAHLRSLGQRLDATLRLGREGVSAAVLQELERLLRAHELVKVRFVNADRDERAKLIDDVAAAAHCACVGAVGHTALFFRRSEDPAADHVAFPA